MSHRLYRGKYLIAVYDKQGYLKGVYDSVEDMADKLGICASNVYTILCKSVKDSNFSSRIKLIDTTPQDDIFNYEDKLFLEYCFVNDLLEVEDICKVLGISQRTYYRYKKKNKLNQLLVKENYNDNRID